jgi:glyoxylase-like metal-dependent hydrolase (beta-lactamase superfamily II)
MSDITCPQHISISRRAAMIGAGAVTSAWLAPASHVAAQNSVRAGSTSAIPVAIRSFVAPSEGAFRITYGIETETGFVMIDAPFRKFDGTAVREAVRSLNKPIRGVIFTHMHPDHNFGVTQMLGGADVPIIATKAVADATRAADADLQKFVPTLVGEAETEQDRRFPNTIASSGQPIRIDGVDFVVTDLGEGESAADAVITLPSNPTAMFVGDLVMPRIHTFMGNGTTAKFLQQVQRLKAMTNAATMIYPGHSGVVSATASIDRQIAYIEAVRSAIREVARGRPQLTDAEKQQFLALMKRFEPTTNLEFVILLGADAVAKELASS